MSDLLEAGVVEAELNYLKPMTEPAYVLAYEPPEGQPTTNQVRQAIQAPIHNLRPIADRFTLDTAGFAFVHHESHVLPLDSEEKIIGAYYQEAAELLRSVTGATRVHIYDHTMRRRITGSVDRRVGIPRQPVLRVHVDQTDLSGPQRFRDLLGDEAEDWLRGRVQIVNVWRPLRSPVEENPLAVCDGSTVAPQDLVPSTLIYPDRRGETYAITWRPEHRWYYAPQMRTDEVLLLKCYDSARDGRVRYAPHTAFADPTTPPDAAPRESIELRALLYQP
jgi:hypothetical protein